MAGYVGGYCPKHGHIKRYRITRLCASCVAEKARAEGRGGPKPRLLYTQHESRTTLQQLLTELEEQAKKVREVMAWLAKRPA